MSLPIAGGAPAVVIDARTFGVKADNVSDDSAAVQLALNAAATNPYGFSNINDQVGAIVQLPAGRIVINSPLLMNANTTLQGQGNSGTYLVANIATGPVISLKTGNEVQCCVRDLGIIINNAVATGIDFNQSAQVSILGDCRHLVENVNVVQGSRAIRVNNGSESRIINMGCYRQTVASGDAAMYIAQTDCFIERNTVAQVQQTGGTSGAGIRLQTSNTRMVDCKVFGGSAPGGNGTSDGGIFVTGQRNQIVGCEAQDIAGGPAFKDNGSNNSWVGCVGDSCQQGGFQGGGGTGSIIRGMWLGTRGGGAFTMDWAFWGNAGDVECIIGAVNKPFNDAATIAAPNHYVINNMAGEQTVAYAATVTPDPYLGGKVYVGTLTAGITLANPSSAGVWPVGPVLYIIGMELTFTLTQNGVGGNAVAFGTAYKTTGAIGTAANSVTSITFRYDGTNWREVMRTVT